METVITAALTALVVSFVYSKWFIKYFEKFIDKFFEDELKWAENHVERTFDEALETIQKIKGK